MQVQLRAGHVVGAAVARRGAAPAICIAARSTSEATSRNWPGYRPLEEVDRDVGLLAEW